LPTLGKGFIELTITCKRLATLATMINVPLKSCLKTIYLFTIFAFYGIDIGVRRGGSNSVPIAIGIWHLQLSDSVTPIKFKQLLKNTWKTINFQSGLQTFN